MDKKALFAGRAGDKSAKPSRSPKESPPKTAAAGTTGEKNRPLSFGMSGAGKGVAATVQRREAQVKEAEDYLKQANKMLTKTITRWNPDFFSAAPLFEKAGACYRAAGEDNKATAMYMQAGECQCHESVLAHASAAKDFREAALITERQGRKDEAAALYLRCAEAWVHGDEPGRAADYFGRSAKLVKETDEDAAAERYIFASKVMVPEGSDSRSNFTRVVGGVDILVQAITFLASTNRLEQSMEVVCRYIIILQAEGIEHSLGRMYLTYCILALAMGDYVRADAAFRDEHLQSTVYLRSEECRVEEELLMAFKDYRPDLLAKVQNDRILHRLETAIVRLAKSLRVPGDEDEGDPIPARETPSGSIGDAQARAQALKEKYGGFASAAESSTKASSPPLVGHGGGGGGGDAGTVPPVPPPRSPATNQPSSSSLSSPPNPKTTSAQRSPMKSANRREATAAGPPPPPSRPTSDDSARDALFGGGGGSRKAKAPLLPSPPATVAAAEAEPQATIFPDSSADAAPGEAEAEVDLGLGDLEASLGMGSAGVGVDNDDDDLEAMIEAARKEAEALALGGDGEAEESEEDIDLT